MNRHVVPLANLARRLPEAGRLRTGVKTAKAMKAIPTWRATSHDEEAIRQLATIYGGTPKPWTDAPTEGQWEVITEAPELRVVLPPDPLGGTPIYESWSGGGCQRRCDGLTAQVLTAGPDGSELTDVACLCAANESMVCTPHTRLSVILPDVRFAGTWRYESATSWTVAQELPGMVDLIQSLQDRGLTRALLAIEPRKKVSAGTTKKFTIPVLRIADSLEALAAGQSRLGSIPSGDRETITGGSPELSAGSDDDVAEAELVEDVADAETVATLQMLIDGLPTDAARRQLARWWKAKGIPGLSSGKLTDEHADMVGDAITDLAAEADAMTASTQEPVADQPAGTASAMTQAQSKKLHAALRDQGIVGPDRHRWASDQLNERIESFSELTAAQANLLIDRAETTTSDEVPA